MLICEICGQKALPLHYDSRKTDTDELQEHHGGNACIVTQDELFHWSKRGWQDKHPRCHLLSLFLPFSKQPYRLTGHQAWRGILYDRGRLCNTK